MNEPTKEYLSSDPKPLYGIGGWLGIYVWTNLIVLPMFIVVMLSYPEYVKNLKPEALALLPKEIPYFERLCLAFIAFLENIACYVLLNKRRRAVWFVKQALLAQIGYLVARFIVLTDKVSGSAQFFTALDQLLQSMLMPLIWYTYFTRSKRVKNTFPETP